MGFADRLLNVRLLRNTKGNVNAVTDWLLTNIEQ